MGRNAKLQRERTIIKKFYDDFDLLPHKYKKLLWEQNRTPNSDDLKAAWELVMLDPECNSFKTMLDNIKCLEKPKPVIADNQRDLKIRRRDYYETRPVYGNPKLRNDKHGNLVRRVVSEQELERMLTTRKQNDEVVSAYVRPIIGYETVKVTVKERGDSIPPEKPEKQASLFKILHNAGGN